ncbi:MAG: hypothetical protein ACE5FM_03615, partial [Methyloligellaceae bacterium]
MNLLALLRAVFAAAFLLVAAPAGIAQTDTPHGQSDGAAKAEQENPASEDAAPAVAKKPEKLMVASWGGAYGESQKRAYFMPFQTETGIAIEVISHKGGLDVLMAEDETARPKWDLVDLGPAAL